VHFNEADEVHLASLGLGRGVSERATWQAGDLVRGVGAALLLFFFVTFAIAGPFLAAYGEDSGEFALGQALAVSVFDASIVFVAYRLARGRGAGWRELGLQPPTGRWRGGRLLGLVLIGYLGAILLVNAYGFAVEALGLEDLLPTRQLDEEFFEHDWVLPLLGFSLVVMAPFAEEVFFRGFIYAGLRRRLAILPAALVSGALFALAHGQPGLIIPFTGVGAILAYAYERTGTLAAPIGVHFLFNLISFLALVFISELR